jgi:hypothetical protein
VQIILILDPKAKIRRKIYRKTRWFPTDFPADLSFKGLKPKNLNIQGVICNKKRYRDENTKNANLQG